LKKKGGMRRVGLGGTQGCALQTKGIVVGVGGFFGGANGFATTNLPRQ